ncbi:CHAD domain-containing protein [Halomonas nitroreducens]|uniref:CHAD domain-containing protein n=1 Tax=Halomonas nitroreducens TaxID=447425 RepID=A0A3S0HQF6_9GAMM|nr:CHAD domain-containing protein [Halomonas nitroreducens]RTQ99645.1 CHAD domain-containing protein [Halomonas nitroreducens]
MGKALHRQPLGTVVARAAEELLDEARAAQPRTLDPKDPEGLHDFRVALRRLRSWLKAYRGYPGIKVPKPLRRQLRDLAKATNAARDGEVMLAWLDSQRDALPADQRGAVAWWRARLEAEVEAAYASACSTLAADFPALETRLRRVLSSLPGGKANRLSFGEASARELATLQEQLVGEVSAIGSAEEREALHRPRITGKRIRYLLRPWKEASPACKDAEKAMKAFQDAYGVLHDDMVRESALCEVVAAHAGEESVDRLLRAARGDPARASAPRHLRGFLGLARGNRQRLLAHYEIAVDRAGTSGMDALSARLDAARAAMRGEAS